MMPMPELLNQFQNLLRSPDEDIDLGEAALLIAKHEYPDLDVDMYLAKLDKMAETIRHKLGSDPTPNEIALAINQSLFDFGGLSGNWHEYYDPRNSFLNEVLDRKLGIPITLSVVYMEVAKRLGLDMQGLGFPGHFLVKYSLEDGEVVLDPFHGGQSLSLEELDRRLRDNYGDEFPGIEQLPHLLEPTPKQEIVTRILKNLKGIYRANSQWDKALAAQNLILVVDENSPEELYDRARLLEKLECHNSAMKDYQRVLELSKGSSDQETLDKVRENLLNLIQQGTVLH